MAEPALADDGALLALLEARLAASKRLAAHINDLAEFQLSRLTPHSEHCAPLLRSPSPVYETPQTLFAWEVAAVCMEWLEPVALGRLACTCRVLRDLVRLHTRARPPARTHPARTYTGTRR